MSHSAFHGQTPDEMYYDRGATIPVVSRNSWRPIFARFLIEMQA